MVMSTDERAAAVVDTIGSIRSQTYEAMLRWLVRGRIRLAYLPQPIALVMSEGACQDKQDRS